MTGDEHIKTINNKIEMVLLEKALTIKKFEYSPLGSELQKPTSTAEKQTSLAVKK